MTTLRTQCEGCGMCCKTIFLAGDPHASLSPDKMKENRNKKRIVYSEPIQQDSDSTFAIHNWYPLTKEEVTQRNPFILQELTRGYEKHKEAYQAKGESLEENTDRLLSNHFYSCNQLDEATGRCMTHDNLPRVCSGYPFDGADLKDVFFYTEDCYYRKDLIIE